MVSIVVVTYNSERTIDRCLDSLVPRPVVVIDNASVDRTAALVRLREGVSFKQNGGNFGFSMAVNQGIAVSAPWENVLVLNPDIEVLPGSVERLERALLANADIGVLAPRLLNVDGTVQPSARSFQSIPIVLARRTNLGYTRWGRSVLAKHFAATASTAITEVDWVLGAAMLLRRSAIEGIGGFDSRYFLYHEDQDLCLRMWRAGWRVCLEPSAVMRHEYARASAQRTRRTPATRYHVRSSIQFFTRYPSVLVGRTPSTAREKRIRHRQPATVQ